MKVIQTAAGVVAVTREGDRLSIHANDGRGWVGVRSRTKGDARDALFRGLGPAVVARLQIGDMR